MLNNDQLDQWDRENFFHPSTHLAQFARGDMPSRIITGGKGVTFPCRKRWPTTRTRARCAAKACCWRWNWHRIAKRGHFSIRA